MSSSGQSEGVSSAASSSGPGTCAHKLQCHATHLRGPPVADQEHLGVMQRRSTPQAAAVHASFSGQALGDNVELRLHAAGSACGTATSPVPGPRLPASICGSLPAVLHAPGALSAASQAPQQGANTLRLKAIRPSLGKPDALAAPSSASAVREAVDPHTPAQLADLGLQRPFSAAALGRDAGRSAPDGRRCMSDALSPAVPSMTFRAPGPSADAVRSPPVACRAAAFTQRSCRRVSVLPPPVLCTTHAAANVLCRARPLATCARSPAAGVCHWTE